MRISDWSSDVCSSDLLIFDLKRAGTRLDHLLGEEIGRLRITEAGVDVGDDRNNMGLVILGLVQQLPFLRAVAGRAGGVDLAEDHAQLARIGLAEEGVKRSEEHTSELQSLMRISYAVFCLKQKQ